MIIIREEKQEIIQKIYLMRLKIYMDILLQRNIFSYYSNDISMIFIHTNVIIIIQQR